MAIDYNSRYPIMRVDLTGDVSNELSMLRGIDYARRHPDMSVDLTYARRHPEALMGTKVYTRMAPVIEKVIFNYPATVVLWSDGTKTVVKAHDEAFDQEKGLAMAISKKFLGNKGSYFNEFKKWIKDGEGHV